MNEFYTVQNYSLGAIALYYFTYSYYTKKEKKSGPVLPIIMPILPIVFNQRSVDVFSSVQRVTKPGFFNLLFENKDVTVGLQSRMMDMYDQTFRSLNLAFSTKILAYEKLSKELIPLSKSAKLPSLRFEDNIKIVEASKTLGKWFALYSIEELCISLNIKL